MTTSNTRPFMTYISVKDMARLKAFAEASSRSMTQVVREALSAKMSDGDPYTAGFNDGVTASINSVKGIKAAQMRFPSGASFADITEAELEKLYLKTKGTKK